VVKLLLTGQFLTNIQVRFTGETGEDVDLFSKWLLGPGEYVIFEFAEIDE
jgi:hypothetical protein